jgi:hypothetical protein
MTGLYKGKKFSGIWWVAHFSPRRSQSLQRKNLLALPFLPKNIGMMWRDSRLLISGFAADTSTRSAQVSLIFADCKRKIRVNSRKSAAKVLLFSLRTVEPIF